MKSFEINIKEEKKQKSVKKRKPLSPKRKKALRISLIAIASVALLTCSVFGYKLYSVLKESGVLLDPQSALKNILGMQDPELKKDSQEITTAMIVGIDTRPSEPGLQNTDSIIAISYNNDNQEAVMISIPRDTMVENPQNPGYYTKINSIYNLCENTEKDTGMTCLRDSVSEIIDRDIHYYAMIDISGLIELVDIIGGVDVNVENSFTDYAFPTPEGSWEVISFESGLQHMDGETAMKFARSRHSMSSEGSDFARARRQQRIILAIKDKVLSMETYTNPVKIFELIDDFGNSLSLSDVSTEDLRAALNLAQLIDQESVHSLVLDPSIANWTLITEDSSEAYALLPTAGYGNWDDINKYIDSYISNPDWFSENSIIYVYNGGLGYNETYELSNSLIEEYPYNQIIFGGNLTDQEFQDILIYDHTEGEKPETIKMLEEYLGNSVESEIPTSLSNLYGEDITIIAGAEIDSTSETISTND